MKKYILYTNNKTKYHSNELIFEDFYELEKHLQNEFDFGKWNYEDIINDFKTYIDDNLPDLIYEYSIKGFLFDNFNILNGMDIELFEKLYKNEILILSTYSDNRYSMVVDKKSIFNKNDYLLFAYSQLLEKHGTTTTPMGVLPIYEIVVEDDYIEGQLELITGDDLPF